MPRASANVRACGLITCAARDAAATVELDPLQVTRELFDRVDRADALDLDRNPVAAFVAAHEVDGADVGRPFAPHELEVLAKRCGSRGELFL